jgi:hypothetical protein
MPPLGMPALALLLFLALLPSRPARAGFIEIAAAGSYRRANIDKNAYDESSSVTGSLSYYLNEMSAIELSYTDGTSTRYIGSTNGQDHTTSAYYRMVGLDFVYTFGERDAILRPYVKGGVAYLLEKRIVDQFQGWPATITEDSPALVPSAGLGVKISITQALSLKAGVEGWMSGDNNADIDYAARVGLSWMF